MQHSQCFNYIEDVGMNAVLIKTGNRVYTNHNVSITNTKTKKITTRIFIQDLGVYCAEGTPAPIPNTEVKLCCVDGTASLDVGE